MSKAILFLAHILTLSRLPTLLTQLSAYAYLPVLPVYLCLVGWLDRDTFTHDGGASERFA